MNNSLKSRWGTGPILICLGILLTIWVLTGFAVEYAQLDATLRPEELRDEKLRELGQRCLSRAHRSHRTVDSIVAVLLLVLGSVEMRRGKSRDA